MAHARICLIHGAATTSRIWRDVVGALPPQWRISCPDRACSGSLDTEARALAALCADAVVVGVSGGATLGWELAARGVRFRAAVLHEPAVGSLVPGLLAPMAAAFVSGGVDAFGATLYGPAWRPAYAPADPDAVARDLAMFQAFEPRPPAPGSGPVTITVGERSPQIRHEAARLLAERFVLPVRVLPGSGHAAHLDQPIGLAALIVGVSA
ncbi:MAG: alpha/beta fold hydrolase [Pseudonocardiaceae bacterium]